MNSFQQAKVADSPGGKASPPAKAAKAILFHAEASDPDMLYFSQFQAFDPYLAFMIRGKRIAVINTGEYGRMVKESAFDEVLLLEDVRRDTAVRFALPSNQAPQIHQMVLHLAKTYQISTFQVSSRFPVGLARKLRDSGMILEIAEDHELFPERQIKTASEIKALRLANKASEAGFKIVSKTLAESTVRHGNLYHGGTLLTAERLRLMIDHAVLDAGAISQHTIAAPGDQAVDNHCAGYGPIRAGELIVVDIFPRRIIDGYWGDMTRTFLKGKASDAQKRLVRTVKKAHQLAIDMMRPGESGGKIHDAVQTFFDKEGYETKRESKEPCGFFHALGHGVGLEIHEQPIMRSKAPFKLREGMVLTVEPGLYYKGLGGCRIEDTLHVVRDGAELISRAPYKWEIP